MDKKPIIIIGVLCVISLGLGYLSGLKDKESPSKGDNNVQTTEKKEPEFLKQGLVAYYPFNGNAKDESGNGNDGEVNGATLTKDRLGNLRSAYDFNEKNFIRINKSESLEPENAITISLWAKVTQEMRVGHCSFVIKAAEKGYRFRWRLDWPFVEKQGFVRLQVDQINGESTSKSKKDNSAYRNDWHHYLAVFEGKTGKGVIYIDGETVGQTDGKSAQLKHSGDLFFMFSPEAHLDTSLVGKLDDIRIYNRALTEAEVKALYEFEKPSSETTTTPNSRPETAAATEVANPIDPVASLPSDPQTFPENNWIELFNGKDLTGWKETDYAGRGTVKVQNGELHIKNGLVLNGVTFTNKSILPKTNYEIEYEAKKVNGSDFFGLLTFPVGDSHASLVTGGWRGAVTGISSINGMDASENNTMINLKFNKNQWYKFRLRVTPDNLSVWVFGTPKEYLTPPNATLDSVIKAYMDECLKGEITTISPAAAEANLRKHNPKLDKIIAARETIYFPQLEFPGLMKNYYLPAMQIINEPIKGKTINKKIGEIKLSAPLGFTTFQTYGIIRNVRLKKLL